MLSIPPDLHSIPNNTTDKSDTEFSQSDDKSKDVQPARIPKETSMRHSMGHQRTYPKSCDLRRSDRVADISSPKKRHGTKGLTKEQWPRMMKEPMVSPVEQAQDASTRCCESRTGTEQAEVSHRSRRSFDRISTERKAIGYGSQASKEVQSQEIKRARQIQSRPTAARKLDYWMTSTKA